MAVAALWEHDNSASVTISSGLSSVAESADVPVSSTQSPVNSPQLLVNINTATVQELCSLPGIGETIAVRIIDYRTAHGLFNNTDEIMNVSGIGAKKYEELKSYIAVG